mmetsp:Transcript_40551/g.94681  ORF Transcript_40551/g.94681 Transcript_40551/m.94681 type:complete len:115 (-) Transcript_40551:1056-1400(-)
MPTPSDVDVDEGMQEAQGESVGCVSAAARLETYARLDWWSDYLPLLKMECEDGEQRSIHAVPEHMSCYRHKQLRKRAGANVPPIAGAVACATLWCLCARAPRWPRTVLLHANAD